MSSAPTVTATLDIGGRDGARERHRVHDGSVPVPDVPQCASDLSAFDLPGDSTALDSIQDHRVGIVGYLYLQLGKKARVVGVAWKSRRLETRLPIRYITGDRMTVDRLVEYAVSLPLNVPNTTLSSKNGTEPPG